MDTQSQIERIKEVLCRYFDVNDDGNPNPQFDEYFTAQDAINDIHDIIGNI